MHDPAAGLGLDTISQGSLGVLNNEVLCRSLLNLLPVRSLDTQT